MRHKIVGETLGQPLFPMSQVQQLRPYLVDVKEDGTTYMCYSNQTIRVIEKISIEDTVYKFEHATGEWDNRESLNYVPINDELFTDHE